MDDYVNEQIMMYFGHDVAKMRLLGITRYAITIYIRCVESGQPKESAINALLQGRTLNPEQVEFVRSVLDRLPMRAKAAGG